MQRYLIFLATSMFSICSVFGQQILLEGKVVDTLGFEISAANVVVTNTASKKMEAFAITDLSGLFKVRLKKDIPYNIKVSFLGLQPHEEKLVLSKDTRKQIVLKEAPQELEGVEVTYEMPVTIVGDTIVYNADSFNTGTEKKLRDVLENLPGVEVNDDGLIEVEGKQVSKVMVEGKDFFDGDSKLATENIPANAVDKVQVLRNFNEVSQLRSVTNNEDNVAINIKLKEGKSKFWFGDIRNGYGTSNRFIVNPKLFYYSPKSSVNLIGNLNNVGENPFTRRDYFRFTGGFRDLSTSSGSSIDIRSDDLGLSSLVNNNAQDIDNKFGATNFSLSPNDQVDFSGFAIVTQSYFELQRDQTRTYIDSGTIEETTQNNIQTNQAQLYKFSTSYHPNHKLQIDYDLLYKDSDEEEDEILTSVTGRQSEEISGLFNQSPKSFNQNLSSYYTLNDQHIFALEVQHLLQKENPFYRTIRETPPFVGTLPLLMSENRFNINQSRLVETKKTEIKLDYYYVLDSKTHLNLRLGTTRAQQDFSSDLFQITDDKTTIAIEGDRFNNDVHFDFKDLYAGLYIRRKIGDLTIEPGVLTHQYTAANEQNLSKSGQNYVKLLPDLLMIYRFRKSENLRFNYKKTLLFSDVNRLAQGYILNNYNSLYSGNPNLEAAEVDIYNLSYFNFNMFNFTNIFANLAYTNRAKSFKSNTELNGINRESTTINSIFDDESLSFSGNIQKRFFNYKARLGVNLSHSKNNNIVNGHYQVSKSFVQNYRTSLSTNFKGAPNVELGYRLTENRYKNGQITQHYTTHQPFAKFDTAFLNGFVLNASYSYHDYKADSVTLNTYQNLSASLSYQKEASPWEFAIEAPNILNTTDLNRDSYNDLFITRTQYETLPQYWVITLKYTL